VVIRRIVTCSCVLLSLGGCSGWFGADEAKPLPGARISVMTLDRSLTPDPRLADLAVRLPKPFLNTEWPQAGGFPNHAMHHLSAKGELKEIWDTDIGDGSNSNAQLLASPVIAKNRIFTVDIDGRVQALDTAKGDVLWRVTLKPKNDGDDDETTTGGLAYANDKIYVTTGFAEVIVLDAANGRELWRRTMNGPMRAAPTVFKGRLFVVTIANELHALDANDGRTLWTHVGIAESAGLLGGASPAADGSVVIASYSSGEIVALRLENGRVIWSDTLTAQRRTDPVSTLAHIRGRPVIDRGRVIASSNSGRTVAIDLRTGSRLWEQKIGSADSVWVAGEFIYLLSTGGEIVCLARRNGGVKWVRQLQRFEDEEDKEGPIYWSGPVLAGDRILVGSSHGEFWSISPYTGKLLGQVDVGGPVFLPAVVAQDTVFVLNDDADLIALS
jgi:outer membrane protein assembly factor BamB